MLIADEPTPCGVMFSLFKRAGGITHRELADIVLSRRPLPSGKSPRDLACDRSWLSHSVVHAPAGTLSPRYFRDWGSAATCVLGRLKSRRGKAMTAEEVVSLLAGERGRAMDRALELCRQDATLYRNAVDRLSQGEGLTPGERAEALLVLFVAAGCSSDACEAVSYAMDYVNDTLRRRAATPTASPVPAVEGERAEVETRLGLIRIQDGYVAGGPHWLSSSDGGVEIGALAMGDGDITDVGLGVSGRHLRVWHDEKDGWLVEDLGSKNGTERIDGASHERVRLESGVPVPLRPADELVLAGGTTLVAIEGVVG